MRMLSTGSSPWASRVRVCIYAKGAPLEQAIEFVPPSGPFTRPSYTADFRFGRAPTLWLDDGTILQESEAILEYFDELHPQPPLKPADLVQRARMRMLVRLADGSVMFNLRTLFPHRELDVRDQAVVDKGVAAMNDGYDRLEYFLGDQDYAVGDHLTLADCTLAPIIWLTLNFLPAYDAPSPLETRPRCAAYWRFIQTDPAVARVLEEMHAHLTARRAARLAEAG